MRANVRRVWLEDVDRATQREHARAGWLARLWVCGPEGVDAYVRGRRLGSLPPKEAGRLRRAAPDGFLGLEATILEVRDEFHAGGPAVRLEYNVPGQEAAGPSRLVQRVGLASLFLFLAGTVSAVAYLIFRWIP